HLCIRTGARCEAERGTETLRGGVGTPEKCQFGGREPSTSKRARGLGSNAGANPRDARAPPPEEDGPPAHRGDRASDQAPRHGRGTDPSEPPVPRSPAKTGTRQGG